MVSAISHDRSSLERFRNASLRRLGQSRGSSRKLNFARASLKAEYAQLSFRERYAAAMGDALKQEPIMLFDDERLVGMLIQVGDMPEMKDAPPRALSLSDYAKHNLAKTFGKGPLGRRGQIGAPGHITWNWRTILEKGIAGLLQDVAGLLDATKDEEAREFYRAVTLTWNRVLDWNRAHLMVLKEERNAAMSRDRDRLSELIRIVEKVPCYPAETFHEALQSFHFQHMAVMFENPFGGNGPGRMDQILGPYLERDLAVGRVTKEQARYLIDELFLRFEERLAPADGWVESVVIGGLNPDGKSCLNTLSYLIVESFMDLDQTHPAVYPRLRQDDPPEYWVLCARYMAKGKNRGQLYNDEKMLAALMASGVPFADAADYAVGGCMEPGIQGKTCDLNFAGYINVAKTLEDVLFAENGSRYATFTDLYDAFKSHVGEQFRELRDEVDITGECMEKYRPTALLSSLMDDCLRRGRDQHAAGARYYDYGFAPLGVTSVVDSLLAIKLAVYDRRFITLTDLTMALKNNYADNEALRLRLRKLPKYGEGNQEADTFCGQVMTDVCAIAHATRTRNGGHLKPMIFNNVWTPEISGALAARADGSLAGDYIGHGMTPQTFAMRDGLTTALGACASLDFSAVSGGATTMWDIDYRYAVPELLEPLIRAFFQRGGMIFQGNTTDVKELEAAFEKPEDYPNLIVRVGGFSARFHTLNRNLRVEVIKRYRHTLPL